MKTQGPHHFTLRYEEDVVRDAIRTFVWRRAVTEQKMMWVISALMLGFSLYLLAAGESGLFAGVMLVLGFAPLAFVAVVWRVHHVNTYQRYKRMGEKTAQFAVNGEGIEITSDLGSGRLAWRNITEAWERPKSFMVFSGSSVFNILPRDGMPQSVQDTLKARAALPPVEEQA